MAQEAPHFWGNHVWLSPRWQQQQKRQQTEQCEAGRWDYERGQAGWRQDVTGHSPRHIPPCLVRTQLSPNQSAISHQSLSRSTCVDYSTHTGSWEPGAGSWQPGARHQLGNAISGFDVEAISKDLEVRAVLIGPWTRNKFKQNQFRFAESLPAKKEKWNLNEAMNYWVDCKGTQSENE